MRVLIADDEPRLAKSVARIVKSEGYEFAIAADGLEAWTLFEAEPETWDMLITDIRMPNLDGVALARRLRGAGSEIPVVFISGHGESPNVGALAPATFVAKPFRRVQLLAAMASTPA